MILRQQISSQKEQINNLKSTIESMKEYMDIFKIDELKKYASVMKERAEADGQLKAEKVIRETFESKDWANKIFEPFKDRFDKLFETDQFFRGQELFNNTIDHFLLLPRDEAISLIKEKYPINGKYMIEEIESIETSDPDFVKEQRRNFLKDLPNHLKTDEERNQIDS
ncbi:hypothetical protein DJ013_20460 [Arcticibacterium luteifluviistationis]|uniref:Uncharacterized protein n=1 Tax=Arcticibacterium luteifluviistationis TaxID=1784714 RepID=A0A2Z4GHK9_9BACT|nr:hypothetical protein DJ013_20460 [Arcticibacterium luteifluviistationis]